MNKYLFFLLTLIGSLSLANQTVVPTNILDLEGVFSGDGYLLFVIPQKEEGQPSGRFTVAKISKKSYGEGIVYEGFYMSERKMALAQLKTAEIRDLLYPETGRLGNLELQTKGGKTRIIIDGSLEIDDVESSMSVAPLTPGYFSGNDENLNVSPRSDGVYLISAVKNYYGVWEGQYEAQLEAGGIYVLRQFGVTANLNSKLSPEIDGVAIPFRDGESIRIALLKFRDSDGSAQNSRKILKKK